MGIVESPTKSRCCRLAPRLTASTPLADSGKLTAADQIIPSRLSPPTPARPRFKVGFSPVEWAPGKTPIAVPSLDKLPTVIETLITAVRQGELDDQLRPTKRPATAKSRKT